jgi:hypothetical protein
MLLDHGCDYNVISSSQTGLLQHSLYTWEVTHNDLVYVEKLDSGSRYFDLTVRDWLKNVSPQQREQFIEALFKIMNASEIQSLKELESSWFTALSKAVKYYGNIDDSTRKMIRQTIAAMFRSARQNIDTLFTDKINEK